MKFKLYKHQQALLDINPNKHLLAWETGTGKSLMAIKLIKGKAIVICPKSLTEQWKKIDSKIFVISKEQFRKKAKELPKYDTVIFDEAHYVSNYKSKLFKTLQKYLKKYSIQYIYLLTATPYLSTPWNIYSLALLLGRKWKWLEFKYNFFDEIRMGQRLIPVPKRNIEPRIARLVANLGNTVRMDECVDIPKQIFQEEYFDLTSEQKKAIKNLDDVLPIVRWTKTHQICGGTLKSDGYIETQHFKSEKLERLIKIVEEHKKIAIVCRYNAEIDNIYNKLHLKYEKRHIIIIQGKTKDKHDRIQEINKMKDYIVLINASCSEGYELPHIPIMIFYSYDFSLKNYIQIKGRIQRINNIKKNVYISLIVKKTIDEDIFKSIKKKQNFDIEIYAKRKRLPN